MANQPIGWIFPQAYWGHLTADSQYPMIFDSPPSLWTGFYNPAFMDAQTPFQASNNQTKWQEQCTDSKEQESRVPKGHASGWVKIEERSEVKVQQTGALSTQMISVKEECSSLLSTSSSVNLDTQVHSQPCSEKQKKCLRYRQSLNQNYEALIDALFAPTPELPFADVLKLNIQRLKQEMHRDYPQISYDMQLEAARKNTTQCYIQLLRFALKLMAIENPHQGSCIAKAKTILSKKLPTIETVVGIYRLTQFQPFVNFLKLNILTEEQLPQLVMALSLKPSDKLIMMMVMPGFLYALHHPHENYGSWDLETHRSSGNTLHIIQAINQRGVGYAEAMEMLEETYKGLLTGKKNDFKYNNISGRYRTIMQRALTELYQQGNIDQAEASKLEDIFKSGGKASSIECLREVLLSEKLRTHIQSDWINNNRLILQILGDGSLKCHTKLTMMKCYPALLRAITQPEEFYTWRS